VIYGTAVAFGYMGQLLLCLVGGWLFDHVGPKTPFFFVGILDVTFAIVCAILGCCGVIKDDIKERKLKALKEQNRIKGIKERLLQEQDGPSDGIGAGDSGSQGYAINE